MRVLEVRTLAPALVIVLGVLVTSGAFTAANTVPDSRAGDGSGVISGFTVSEVDWAVDSGAPYLTDKVSFTLDVDPGATGEVRAKAAGTWYPCVHTGAAVTCDFPDGSEPGVATMTALRVVIAE